MCSSDLMEPGKARLVANFSEGRLGQALHLDPDELQIKLRQYWALLFGVHSVSATHVFDMSESLVKSQQVQEAIHWFQQGLRDLLFLALDETNSPALYREQEPALRQLAQLMTPSTILELSHELNQLERGQQRNLNMQIGLEQFFFHLHDRLGYAHDGVRSKE